MMTRIEAITTKMKIITSTISNKNTGRSVLLYSSSAIKFDLCSCIPFNDGVVLSSSLADGSIFKFVVISLVSTKLASF